MVVPTLVERGGGGSGGDGDDAAALAFACLWLARALNGLSFFEITRRPDETSTRVAVSIRLK